MNKETGLKIPTEELEEWRRVSAEMYRTGSNYEPDRITIPYRDITEFALEHLLLRQQENYKNLETEYNRLKQQVEAQQQQPSHISASAPAEESQEQKNERMLRCIHRVMKEGVMTQKNHWQAILCILCDKGYYSQRTDYKGFCQWMQAMADDKHPFVPELNYNSIKKNDDYYKPYAEWKAPKGKKAQEMHNVAQRFKELLEIEEAKTVSIHAARANHPTGIHTA